MKPFFLFTTLLFLLLCSTACVSSKVFNALETDYASLKKEQALLEQKHDSLQKDWKRLQENFSTASDSLSNTRSRLLSKEERLKLLQTAYEALEKNSDSAIQKNIAENKALLASISEKETLLETRMARVNELEQLIQSQEETMETLKETLSNALLNFEGKGLTVEHRDGKVFVSMENKLLFKSGQWTVGKEGNDALKKLAQVLANNPDISVLIEGHTDNVPYTGKGNLKGNWDLSTKRATAVVAILLENSEVLPQNLTAAGRSEFIPIAPNSSTEGKASNRRIEVILTPEWDEIKEILNNY